MGFQWEFVLPLSIAHFTVYINTDPTPQRAAHNPHKTQHTVERNPNRFHVPAHAHLLRRTPKAYTESPFIVY